MGVINVWRVSTILKCKTSFTDSLSGLFSARILLMHTMTFVLFAFIFTSPVSAFAGGDGSEGDPYRISNVDELQNMKLNVSAHYVLINDIDASETVNWNDGAGFEPVGQRFRLTQFTGTLDGNGYNIENLYINRSSSFYIGLFGYTGPGSQIESLCLTDVNITGNYYVGGLAGYSKDTTITNSCSEGEVTGKNHVGGLVGHNVGGTINNSHSDGKMAGYLSIGGLVGWNEGGTITSSYSNVNLIEGSDAGGLVGVNRLGSRITSSYSTGNISGYDTAGGLVGWNVDSEVIDSYSTGNVTGDRHIGGLVGSNGWSGHEGQIKNSYSTCEVSGNNRVGGLVGRNWYGEISNSWSAGDVTGLSYTGGLAGYNVGGIIADSHSTGSVVGTDRVGGLIGESYSAGSITNSYCMGDISGSFYTGGLVGRNAGSTIADSYSMGTVNGTGSVGGLVGYNTGSGKITDSYSTCEVSGNDRRIGGLVGSNRYATIINSNSAGNVNGYDEVGGLAGHSYQSVLQNTYSTGAVSGNNMIGGLVGYTASSGGYEISVINISCSSGHVTGNDQVGGLIGSNSLTAINNTYSIGDVIGNDQVGGFVGSNMFGPMFINNSYSIGDVSGSSRVGGFVGRYWYNAPINSSYWNTETSGQSTSAGGEARTIMEMVYPHAPNTYVDWDFENVWSIHPDINDGYPYLRVFIDLDTPSTPTVLTYNKGNFYVNWSWKPGLNTDSFNVSVNDIWYNGTADVHFNDTSLDPHGTSVISVYAFNESKNTLSRPASSSVQLDNNPVTLTGLHDVEINKGETVYVNPGYTDLDGDTPEFTCNRTDMFNNFSNVTGAGSWTSGLSDKGSYSILFTVDDGHGSSDSQSIIITVLDAGVDKAPKLHPVVNRTVDENEVLDFTISATDPDGDPIVYSAMGMPATASLNDTTGKFAWTPGPGDAGIYEIKFIATANGLSDSQVMTITVNEASQIVFSITDNAEKVAVGSEFTYSIFLRNTKNIELTDIRIVDKLPPELGFVSAAGSMFNESTNTVTIEVPDLMPGESTTVLLTVKALSCGSIENSATMYCAQQEPVSCKDVSTIMTAEEIPEFPTIAIPVLTIVGVSLVFMKRKE